MQCFRWKKKFQEGFTNLKDGSCLDQPKIVVTNANIAAVAGLIKGVCSVCPHRLPKEQKGYSYVKCAKNCDKSIISELHVPHLQLMEPVYINFEPQKRVDNKSKENTRILASR